MREKKAVFGAFGLAVLITAVAPVPIEAQLAADWMVPAAAHNRGSKDTFWRTDVSLHNPHEFDLPIVVQVLPSDTVNFEVPTLTFTIYPWETINLWAQQQFSPTPIRRSSVIRSRTAISW